MIRRSPRSTRTATLFPTRRSSYLVDAAAEAIQGARVFVTQLEQPVAAARRALEIARAADVVTVFNPAPAAPFDEDIRSEEHTSELQSLMRISYAVFCLKKKKHTVREQKVHHEHTKQITEYN